MVKHNFWKLIILLVFCSAGLVASISFVYAQNENLTITTYYPSPYGVYNKLLTNSLGVGDNSGDTKLNSLDVPTTPGDVWIKGNVGIGTGTIGPQAWARLDIRKQDLQAVHIWTPGVGGLTLGYGSLGPNVGTIQARDSGDGNNANLILQNWGGNVGIGTTVPSQKLEVHGEAMLNSGAADGARLIWRGGAGGTQEYRARVFSTGNLGFFPVELGSPGYIGDTLILSHAGNVAIGLDNGVVEPPAKLAIFRSSATEPQVSIINPTSGAGQIAGIRMSTASGWNVQLRTVQGTAWLELTGSGGQMQHRWNAGDYTATGNVYATGHFYSSDRALKDHIQVVNDPLQNIAKLEGVSFQWKKDGRKDIGLVAQDVEKVYPELVSTDSHSGLKSVSYGSLIPVLIEAVKEQQKQIQELKSEIADLKMKK